MGKYKFINPDFYSNKPVSELKGIILLTPPGEAEQIAKSKVFIGTVQDTVGTWFNKIKTPILAIGDLRTRELFNRAKSGDQNSNYWYYVIGNSIQNPLILINKMA